MNTPERNGCDTVVTCTSSLSHIERILHRSCCKSITKLLFLWHTFKRRAKRFDTSGNFRCLTLIDSRKIISLHVLLHLIAYWMHAILSYSMRSSFKSYLYRVIGLQWHIDNYENLLQNNVQQNWLKNRFYFLSFFLGVSADNGRRYKLFASTKHRPLHRAIHMHRWFERSFVKRDATIISQWPFQFFGVHNDLLCRKYLQNDQIIIILIKWIHLNQLIFDFQIYLQTRMTWRGSRLLKHFLQFALIMMTWFTCLSRISNYKHHWSDVLVGASLGVTIALLVANFVSDLGCRQQRKDYLGQPRYEMNTPHATNNGTLTA